MLIAHLRGWNILTEIKIKTSCKSITETFRSSLISLHSLLLRNSSKKIDKMTSKCFTSKPPNFLIYCDADDFDAFKTKLGTILNLNKYTIYHLNEETLANTPWKNNSEMLLVSKSCSEKAAEEFKNYRNFGGKILFLCSDLLFKPEKPVRIETKLIENLSYKKDLFPKIICDSCETDEEWNLVPNAKILATFGSEKISEVILSSSSESNEGKTVYSSLHLLRDPDTESLEVAWRPLDRESLGQRRHILRDILASEFDMDCSSTTVPDLTPCYFLGKKEDKESVLSSLHKRCVGDELKLPSLTVSLCPGSKSVPPTTASYLPVKTEVEEAPGFDSQGYFDRLRTQHLGQLVLFTPVVPTTMTVIQGFAEFANVIAIAKIQTQGRGRGGNQWLSPEGCAMFSFPLTFLTNSNLGRRPSMVQHVVGLAVVEGILSIPGCAKLDVRVKWPNDIYVAQSQTKIGGLIVTSSTFGGQIQCVAGVGVNVSNEYPTLCLNSLLSQQNLPSVTVEEVIASALNQLEKLVNDFQVSGPEKFIRHYLERWIHSNAEVTLQSGERVRVVGLDEYGFLRVRLLGGDGRELTLQPDGNSFDMMSNLIVCKENP